MCATTNSSYIYSQQNSDILKIIKTEKNTKRNYLIAVNKLSHVQQYWTTQYKINKWKNNAIISNDKIIYFLYMHIILTDITYYKYTIIT